MSNIKNYTEQGGDVIDLGKGNRNPEPQIA